MVDSPKFLDTPRAPSGSVGNFGDLAQQILDGQIAQRRPAPTNQQHQDLNPARDRQNPEIQNPQASPPVWRPMQIDLPIWTLPLTSQLPPGFSLPNYQAPSLDFQRIPTLTANLTAEKNDASIYHVNSDQAKLYNENRASIVRVFGHARGQAAEREYTGSGFFVSDHGDVATAYHVISELDSIRITTSDGIEHLGKVVATRPNADVAIVHIDTNRSTQPVKLADTSNFLRGGEPIYTIGHPSGWTKEYFSPGRYISTDTIRDITGARDIDKQNPHHILLTTSQNIQGGDSGAPAFNAEGKVVGIVSRGDQGSHGYMVPVDDLWPLMSKVAAPRQTTEYKLGDLPFRPHFSSSQLPYAASAALTASNMMFHSRILEGVGVGARGATAVLAGVELWKQDLPFLENAIEHGSTRERVSATTEVAADVLMIGGTVITIVPRYRSFAPAMSMAGSLLKVGNSVAAYRSYS